MRVTELIGPLLDYWVARATRIEDVVSIQESAFGVEACYLLDTGDNTWGLFCPSVSWADGGPIIERERIEVVPWNEPPNVKEDWRARTFSMPANGLHPSREWRGSTALIAAMRAYVASKFGEYVDDSETQR